MASKSIRINEMISKSVNRERKTYSEQYMTSLDYAAVEVAATLSKIKNDNIRVDLIREVLMLIEASEYRIVELTNELIYNLFDNYFVVSYKEYYFEEDINQENWVDWWDACLLSKETLQRLAIQDLLNITKNAVDNTDRTFICVKDKEVICLYYYGRDCDEKKDYEFWFAKK